MRAVINYFVAIAIDAICLIIPTTFLLSLRVSIIISVAEPSPLAIWQVSFPSPSALDSNSSFKY